MNEQKAPGGIEWTRVWERRGYTWNPVVGCAHDCAWNMPDGKRIVCYAKAQAESGRLARFYPEGFSAHYFHEGRLDEPTKVEEPSGIFISSMGDLFGALVTYEQLDAVFDICRQTPQHIYFALTKAPARMDAYVRRAAELGKPVPTNVWLGVSTPADEMNGQLMMQEKKEAFMETALRKMIKLRAGGYTTFLSMEPISWDASHILSLYPGALSWVILGAASDGPAYFAPDMGIVKRLQAVLDHQGIPTFYKGNLRAFVDAVREEFPPET